MAAGFSVTVKPGRECACWQSGPLAQAAPAWAAKVIIPAGMRAEDARQSLREKWEKSAQ
jgi:hypothetical protein